MSSVELRRSPSSAARAAIVAALVVAMCVFGFGVYHGAGLFKGAKTQIQRPTDAKSPALPGVMYVVQGGAIYRFAHGSFVRVTPEDGWMQPSASLDGSQLVAVKRSLNRSDLYMLKPNGRGAVQLTDNRSPSVETNHWAFYPRLSPDASAVYFSYDPKDPYNSYRVDLAIFATSATGPSSAAVQWTEPNQYTGGDVGPVPLQGGGLVYTRFSIDDQSNVHSQIWFQARPGSPGVGLTKPADDCSQPAMSRDETMIAMVCRHGLLQGADLEVARVGGSALALGSPAVVVRDQLLAAPSFSPDGKLLAYLAPADSAGTFQLWAVGPSGTQGQAPRQITRGLDLDPASAPVWTV